MKVCGVATLEASDSDAALVFTVAEFKKVARAKRKGKRKFAVKVCTLRAT